ncbi:MAG TPA: fatty acid desaturase [Steroidobacteraceae bacterium]|nr:fatty acid desaturase [Steroidobacteraceae bacterium]
MSIDFLYGLAPLPWWGYALTAFVLIQLMFLGITLFLHREQAHDALELHPALRHFFRFWLWLSSGTVTKQWVAVHRKHHVFADREGDPHSPVLNGLRHVLLQGYELYVVAARDPVVLDHYGRGTPDDWIERHLYSRFPSLGLVFFVAGELVLFGAPGIIMIAVHIAAQPFCAAGIINGMGHAIGYRSFETDSAATNIVPWGLLIGGEELHNNHHAFPRSARFSVQRWELDLGWLFLQLFSALGLARVKWVAPRLRRIAGRQTLDAATVQALFVNRMHVLRDYARRVVRPVCRELARGAAGKAASHLSTLLVRHPKLLGEEGLRRLHAALEQHEALRAVVEFRERLQQLWNDGQVNPSHAVAQLREWCAQAEASGIQALREFAEHLRSYGPASA